MDGRRKVLSSPAALSSQELIVQAGNRLARRRRNRPLNADDLVDALIWEIQSDESWRGVGAANVVRQIMGRPARAGLIEARRLDAKERVEFKAWLFDLFFKIYGPMLPGALRMAKAQQRGSKSGVDERKKRAAATSKTVLRAAQELRRSGMAMRNIAGSVARKVGLSPQYVRGILRKAKLT